MKDDEKEKKLIELMAVERPEAFWLRQKRAISGAAAGSRAASKTWLLMPAAAAAALAVIFLVRQPEPAADYKVPSVSTAFLENLDLLDDMDVLEAVPESEL